MNNDLISREALKKAFHELINKKFAGTYDFEKLIDNAPTVELDECVIQEVLNKRCMTAVANEYLIALHGKRPKGEWIVVSRNCWKCPYCQELTNEGKKFCPNCGADMKGGAE